MPMFRRLVLVLMIILAASIAAPSAEAATYRLPPTGHDQWYWEIGPPKPGLAGLPATTGAYPAPGSANIWDTDLFEDSNTAAAGIPTGRSPVVTALHASGKYSICYVEVGAFQSGFPDNAHFAPADYGHGAHRYGMQGYPDEWWLNLAGFRNYVAGDGSTLTGAAVDIAAALDRRFRWCALEGQDAVEPDDLDGYTNKSDTGVPGGGWHLTQADSAGFERWLAYDIHAHGLAAFQKNDPANAPANAGRFDGMVLEECNHYRDPCAGSRGDATPFLHAGKPVLNAEYTEDGERTATFCPADAAAGLTGALFDVDLGGKTYRPCAPVGTTRPGGMRSAAGGIRTIRLATGFYVGRVLRVDLVRRRMTFTITSSCGRPSSGTWRIGLLHARFEVYSNPATGQGQTQRVGLRAFRRAARRWKRWHITASRSRRLTVSDAPDQACA